MSNPKCAACTFRRKRCVANCVFAPYFPVEKAEDFDNVCWLFGVQNATNILRSVTEEERTRTAETLVLEARMRRENPVHGSLEIERRLQDEIGMVQQELAAVRTQLEHHKSKGKEKVDD